MLVALLLLPSSGRPTAKNVALTDGTEEESDGVSLQEIEESSAKTDQEDIDGVLLQDKTATPTDVSATLDLQLAADLCTDLGQLSNTSQLNVILASVAQVFNANGIIVWILDGNSRSLRPAIGHGYSKETLAKLGTIPCDDDNATAVTFRDEQMPIVPAEPSTLGAITAPIVSMSGCIGVLSLELRDEWEQNEEVQATAAILAAQLSTLVVPDATVKNESAEAAQA